MIQLLKTEVNMKYIGDKDKIITVRTSTEKYEKLKEVAEKKETTVSGLIQYMIDDYLRKTK